jgi:tRNA A-37 threonylcarbamoyl transferase component Bud32
MANDVLCPDTHDLQRLVLGQVSDQETLLFEKHLEQCERCFETLHALGAGDTLLEAMRSARPEVVAEADRDMVESLIVRLKQVGNSAGPAREAPSGIPAGEPPACPGTAPTQAALAAAPSPQELWDFLAPAQDAGELGRFGRYRILKVLGAGGMGVVFQAQDLSLGRLVALKAMKPALAASSQARQRFLREARATATIEHDHIVTIYEVSQDRDIPFLAMQLLKGETLADRLKREHPLPEAEVLRIGREIAEGLAVAHEQGLIHRDIKPANIWLEERGARSAERGAPGEERSALHAPRSAPRVKILDFGLARPTQAEEGLTQTGVVLGTPEFMAPEQGQGKAVDARCDLFSLGCVLYQMATGQGPFRKPITPALLMANGQAGPQKTPRELNPELSPELSALVIQLLAQDPAGRPPSARAVVEAIQALEAAGEEKAAARPGNPAGIVQDRRLRGLSVSGLPAGSRWRRRAMLAVAATLLVALGLSAHRFGPALIRIAANHGELVIQTDQEVEVVLKQGGQKIRVLDTKTKRTFDISAGEYEA